MVFRLIVEAVAELHNRGYVHRDIKSKNLFIASDGRPVLGDFGIVAFEDDAHTRVTEEFERVGSRDWMAPWAHTGLRVDDVRPSFDVFPLGKLPWVMISGRPILPSYQTHRRTGFELDRIFPDRPGMTQTIAAAAAGNPSMSSDDAGGNSHSAVTARKRLSAGVVVATKLSG
jgi:serine/threonine protein kinase